MLGFMCLYYTSTYAIYSILYTKQHSFAKPLLFSILLLLACTTPLLTFILVGIPALLLSFIHRRMEYSTEKHLQFDIIITISISIGFLLQFYVFPSKQIFSVSTTQPSFFTSLTQNSPLFIFTTLIGILYTFFYAISKKSGVTLITMRIASLGMILGGMSSLFGILDTTLYFLFILFFTFIYATPHCIITLLSLLTMSKVYKTHIIFLFTTLSTIIAFYYNYNFHHEKSIADELITYLQSSSSTSPQYILAPHDIATQITLFNSSNIIAIPYIPHTLEYTLFTPDEQQPYSYSALIIDKDFEHTLLMQQLLTLIGEPTHKTIIHDYIIMEYNNGFTMPNTGKLAIYTTPLGNIIRSSIKKAPLIPQPQDFTVHGIPIKELRILHNEGKSFILLVFDKNTPPPTNTDYSLYTLSPSSSAFRKLASAMRREIPLLASLLPFEDKNTLYIDPTKDIYILEQGDIVIPINITNTVKDSLTFLSISIEGSQPVIVFQYPTPPIHLSGE